MASWKGATCEPQPGSAGIAHQPVAAQRERQKEVPIKWGFLAHGADRFSAWPRSHRCANPETFRIWLCPSARRAAKRTGSLSSDAGRRTRTRVRRDPAWEGKFSGAANGPGAYRTVDRQPNNSECLFAASKI